MLYHQTVPIQVPANDDRLRLREAAVSLYGEGLSTREVAARLGIGQSTVVKYIRMAGLEARPPGRPAKYAAPEPRPCQTCGTVFTPAHPSADVRQNQGRYCSWARRIEGMRKYQPAEERPCARCGKTFRPRAADAIRGRGIYCSKTCRKGGELVTCAHCGKEAYRHPSRLRIRQDGRATRRESRFCSPRCWGLYRWKHKEALRGLVDGMVRDELLRGRRKQVWFGRWGASKAPGPGAAPRGRARGYTEGQRGWVLGLRENGFSIRAIARTTGLSKWQVESILTAARVSGKPF